MREVELEQRLVQRSTARLEAEMVTSAYRNAKLPGVTAEVLDRVHSQELRRSRQKQASMYPASLLLSTSLILLFLCPLPLASPALVPWRTPRLLQEDTPGSLAARISFCAWGCFGWHPVKGWYLRLYLHWPCKNHHHDSWFSWVCSTFWSTDCPEVSACSPVSSLFYSSAYLWFTDVLQVLARCIIGFFTK